MGKFKSNANLSRRIISIQLYGVCKNLEAYNGQLRPTVVTFQLASHRSLKIHCVGDPTVLPEINNQGSGELDFLKLHIKLESNSTLVCYNCKDRVCIKATLLHIIMLERQKSCTIVSLYEQISEKLSIGIEGSQLNGSVNEVV
ncbi:hypothetical protein G5I_04452 [Acromyrmex echinatior]|uniref:Uncharacterized protein n=1 Tax=Acromyrmex echinatior TaxID=103372 RepID=F4WFP3_ACREC|nr:hypothetical protein G5I_04452 [Acromyrmex echinatior]